MGTVDSMLAPIGYYFEPKHFVWCDTNFNHLTRTSNMGKEGSDTRCLTPSNVVQ